MAIILLAPLALQHKNLLSYLSFTNDLAVALSTDPVQGKSYSGNKDVNFSCDVFPASNSVPNQEWEVT